MKHIKFSKEETDCLLHLLRKKVNSVTQDELSQPEFIKKEFYYPLFDIENKLITNETKYLKREVLFLKYILDNFGIKKEFTEINGFINIQLINPFLSAYKKL